MKSKIYKILVISLFILFIGYIVVYTNYEVILSDTDCKYRIGIIDANLSKKYDRIVYSEDTNFDSSIKTHGDNLIAFIFDCQKVSDLYYFDATYNKDEIDTSKIIEGLDWMLLNSVERVNLSLSNTVMHTELETWIKDHNEIKVYASYNNKLNSYDYPAMYEGVYASGIDSRINYKDIDIKYHSNKIICIINGFKRYNGNSYLSILSMLRE